MAMKKVFRLSSGLPNLTTRTPRVISSLVTPGGDTNLKETPEYTGSEMLGISIIHKSCLQPVFSIEAAVDAANMRR